MIGVCLNTWQDGFIYQVFYILPTEERENLASMSKGKLQPSLWDTMDI